MARPNTTTTGRSKPSGKNPYTDKRENRTGVGGLNFSRIPGIRRVTNFPADPREIIQLNTPADDFESRYQIWFATWKGTRPEFMVFDYLLNRLKYRYGIDFSFQSSFLGGRQRLGGSVVDFEVYRNGVFIRVQGERFHLGPEKLARDTIQSISIARTGYRVVDIWAEQVMQAPHRVIDAALRGVTLRAGINP